MLSVPVSPASASTPMGKSGSSGDAQQPQQQQQQQYEEPGTLYKFIMTPVNLITFLFSLLLVDLRYSYMRSHSHAQAPSRLPAWLHSLFYRPQPYQYTDDGGGRWYYHSKQKKLMRMEADEAFKMRHTVLLALAVLVAAVSGAVWYLATRMYRHYLHSAWMT